MGEIDGLDPTAPAHDVAGANDGMHRPVTTLDQHIRSAKANELQRRVVTEPGDHRHRLQCRHHRQTIRQRIDRTIRALGQSAHGIIIVQCHDQTGAQRTGFGQVSDMTAMQDVEHAIGEDQRSRQLPDRWCQVGGCNDLLFETHRHVADQRRRCVISDTFITSPKNSRQLASEADCVASSAAALASASMTQ